MFKKYEYCIFCNDKIQLLKENPEFFTYILECEKCRSKQYFKKTGKKFYLTFYSFKNITNDKFYQFFINLKDNITILKGARTLDGKDPDLLRLNYSKIFTKEELLDIINTMVIFK